MSEFVIIACEAGAVRCGTAAPPPTERWTQVRAKLDEARALLEPAGLWSVAPVIVLDAHLEGAIALTVPDLKTHTATEGLTAHTGRPAILFAADVGAETDLDVLLHELTHVWMRTRGANDARWRLDDGRANHESALVHEALADFVAAALTQDPVLAEGLGLVTTNSLRIVATCPHGLTGSAHADAVLLSGALWELGGAENTPDAMADTLAALTQSAIDGSKNISTMVDHLTTALAARSPMLAARWTQLVERRGLRKCHLPINIDQTRASARANDFLAAGTHRFQVDEVTGPIHFTAAIDGVKTVRINGRSSQRDALSIDWQARDAQGHVLEKGRTPFQGWPSQFATLPLPPSSHTLTFGFVTATTHDVTYNDIGVTPLERYPAITSAPDPAPRSGCVSGGLFGPLDLVAPLLLGWLMRRRAPIR